LEEPLAAGKLVFGSFEKCTPGPGCSKGG